MHKGDLLARPDRARELVALIQRRSLAFLPVWGALTAVGLLGANGLAIPPSRPYLVPATYVVGFLLLFVLRGWHRRRYGDVRQTESQRLRGQLAGLAMFVAFLVMMLVGPRAVPSPLPFTFAVIFATALRWDPWRVSLHWLPMVGVLLWLSVVHVFGPEALSRPWAYSLFIGSVGALCSTVDHMLMVRMIRQAPGGMVLGAQHV